MIEQMIERAGFDDNDRDLATGGLCGTFALALREAAGEGWLHLLCLNGAMGKACSDANGVPMWRHAVLVDGDCIYDIDGKVRLEDLVENYCWGNPHGNGGSLIEVTPERLTAILQSDAKSFDQISLDKWTDRLVSARQSIQEPVTP